MSGGWKQRAKFAVFCRSIEIFWQVIVQVRTTGLPDKTEIKIWKWVWPLWFALCACVQVKPLGVIWGKYGEFYNRKNTIMFDDIGRNFLMNPQNGLKVDGQHPLSSPLFLSNAVSMWGPTNCICVHQIRPFMKAHLNREKDRELYKLSQYLKEIAKLDDFSGLNHKHWERWAHVWWTEKMSLFWIFKATLN